MMKFSTVLKRTTFAGLVFAATAAIPGAVLAQEAPVASKGSAGQAYHINAGDDLEIYVWGEERLQRGVKVLPDGTFAFPLAGQVAAAGRTPQELEGVLSSRLKDQYRGQVPQITVSVKSATGLQFSVMGRVRAPGTFSPGRYLNLLEALSLSGGPAEFANLDNILILRKNGDTLTTIKARIGGLFKGSASASDVERANIIRIEPGDTVIVP